jgi:integrase
MRGHVRQRGKNGHWYAVLDIHDPVTGTRRRKWISLPDCKGRRQAQVRCAELISELQKGTQVDSGRIRVAAFFDRWLEHMQGQVSSRSLERYTELAQKNLAPLLGALTLSKVQPAHISQAYAKALTSGRRDGKGGLSARTVTHMHRVLHEALQQAVVWRLLANNPAAFVKPPKVQRAEMKTYDLQQTVELLEALRGNRMFIPTLLAGLCGLRRGEIAALRWRHVSFEAGHISIEQSAEQTHAGVRYKPPKSGRARTVAMGATVAAELRAHRLAQVQVLLSIGVRLSEDTFVVAQADGSPVQPNTLTHNWVIECARIGLPRIRFHDMRHTHATHLLASGVHPKVASERLGHSKVGLTLDTYSHVLPNMQADAAALVDDALQAALQSRTKK